MPTFQTPFGKHRSDDLHFSEDEPSLTQQSMAEECDINFIMAKYQKHGVIEHVNSVQGQYGDFVTSTDYQVAMNEVLLAREAFESLPSSLRNRFENDPVQFLDFVHDDKNREEMIQLGLIEVPVENVNDVQSVSDDTQNV